MKKFLLFSIFLFLGSWLLTSQSYAQEHLIVPDGGEYNQLKLEGRLNDVPKEKIGKYVNTLNLGNFIPMSNPGVSNLTSGCLQTLDSSYTLALPSCDDGSSSLISIPFNFCFYGTNENSFYINNNGNISFGTSYSTYSSDSFPNINFIMIAPFWADVDTRGTGGGAVYYKVTSTYAIIKWSYVGYYGSQTDKLNDFQLIISNGTDPIISGGNNVAFCYGDMQWTTGSASGGTAGFGGTPATVGSNRGNGTDYIQFGRFDHAGVDYDGPFGNADGISYLDNQSFIFNTCVATSNIPPIASNSFNDTIQICVNDTFPFNLSFLSPEQTQITATVIDSTDIDGFQLFSNTDGNVSEITGNFYATQNNIGVNTIVFTATDNGTPPLSTIVTVNFNVTLTGGISEQNQEMSALVYPIPVTNELSVKYTGSEQLRMIKMVNTFGQIIFQHSPEKRGTDYSFTFNMSNLAQGYYFIQFITETSFINRKVLKQ